MKKKDSTLKKNSLRCVMSWIMYLSGMGLFASMAVYDGLYLHSNLGIMMAVLFVGFEIVIVLGILLTAKRLLLIKISNRTANQIKEKRDTMINLCNGRLTFYIFGFPLMIAVVIGIGIMEVAFGTPLSSSLSCVSSFKEEIVIAIVSITALILWAISEIPNTLIGLSAIPTEGRLAEKLKEYKKQCYEKVIVADL